MSREGIEPSTYTRRFPWGTRGFPWGTRRQIAGWKPTPGGSCSIPSRDRGLGFILANHKRGSRPAGIRFRLRSLYLANIVPYGAGFNTAPRPIRTLHEHVVTAQQIPPIFLGGYVTSISDCHRDCNCCGPDGFRSPVGDERAQRHDGKGNSESAIRKWYS